MDFFDSEEEAKSKYLVKVRTWTKPECISFLSGLRTKFNLAPNVKFPAEQLLEMMTIEELKTLIVKIVQSCESVSQLETYELKYS